MNSVTKVLVNGMMADKQRYTELYRDAMETAVSASLRGASAEYIEGWLSMAHTYNKRVLAATEYINNH